MEVLHQLTVYKVVKTLL